jgi:hypothetical protein
MAALASDSGFSSGKRHWSPGGLVLLSLSLCLAVLATTTGCSGCRKTPQQIQAEREKEEAERRAKERERRKEKKPDLEMGKLVSLPHEWGSSVCPYKPGHWTTADLPAKANNFDLWGDLETVVVDRRGKPMRLIGMPYTSSGSREVALPKGRRKTLECVLQVPPAGLDAFVSSRISGRKGGRGVYEQMHLNLKRMPAYQYHFVVLARWPQSYKYLEGLDSVKNPTDVTMGTSQEEWSLGYYRVHLVTAEKRATLPRHALFWTSIAYVLWDDAEPSALGLEQRTALLDWLHWGGQLIISGPDSLDALANSYLDPYLPATTTRTRELTAADLKELDARWTLPVHQRPGRRLAPAEPWGGIAIDVHPEAREVPGTRGLLVERRVGRGRIVVSAFELDSPELTSWPGFDGFFNACLLGRPPRRFIDRDFEVQVTWADGRFHQFDPRAVSGLRYFSRDTGPKQVLLPEGEDLGPVAEGFLGLTEEQARRTHGPDVGSWSDFNPVANSAREALKNAARIEIPERMFVVWVVAVYLLVLVPANWLVFRAIGRVEWAWAAAPVIAVVYTGVVIRLAQLDIGFARSLSEIAIVETQDEYPRAHVTRYTALYTSLATTYDFRLEDPGAQVQPFPKSDDLNYRYRPGELPTRLQYRFGSDVRMRGFHVISNTTGMVHSEQMVDLGGAVLLRTAPGGGLQVANQTTFVVHEAGVVRRTESGQVETAWLGTLKPGDTGDLQFVRQSERNAPGSLWMSQRRRSPLTASEAAHGELHFRKLVETAEDPSELEPGDVRLVGWLDEEIPGLEIRPKAPQSRRAALVVAHLRRGFGQDPQPDANTRREKEDVYRTFGPNGIGR